MTSPIYLKPDTTFPELAAALQALGYARDDTRPVTPEMIPGEPELAGFRGREGHRLVYTFNPVIRLRELQPEPLARAAWFRLTARLPVLHPAEIARLLASDDPRDLLLALIVAERTDEGLARPRAGELREHPERAVATTAARVHDALEASFRAALAGRALLRQLEVELGPALAELPSLDASALRERLAPREGDVEAIFVADAHAAAHAADDEEWLEPYVVAPAAGATEVVVHASPAGMLTTENDVSFHFPGSYRRVAHLLAPDKIWLTWCYQRPGAGGGLLLDGLVCLDGHFAWFPKPYRWLTRLANLT